MQAIVLNSDPEHDLSRNVLASQAEEQSARLAGSLCGRTAQ